MRAIDTNVVVRLIARDDVRQIAAAEAFVSEPGVWVSTLVLAEAIWVLSTAYAMNPDALATAIEMLLKHRSLVLEHNDAVAAAVRLFRERPGLRFTDCLILELARAAGHLPLGTFDRRLAKVDGVEKL
jgi:predicted nucleic-acid-binding protein